MDRIGKKRVIHQRRPLPCVISIINQNLKDIFRNVIMSILSGFGMILLPKSALYGLMPLQDLKHNMAIILITKIIYGSCISFFRILHSQLQVFAQGQNSHKIQVHEGLNHSPEDMFVFDMMANGIHGNFISDHLSDEELEIYGIDWAAQCDEQVLMLFRENTTEPASSWIGKAGSPSHLNEVPLICHLAQVPTLLPVISCLQEFFQQQMEVK